MATDIALQHEVEQFLYHEAELLDDQRIEEWTALLADDVRYFVPLRMNVGPRDRAREWSGDTDLAYMDEDKQSMLMRLRKLQSGQAWAEEPPSRTRHMITNIRINAGDEPDEFAVKSALLCYRNRTERQTDFLVGERRDVLRRTDREPGFTIARRTVLLDQSTFLSNNLSFFL